MSCSEIQEETTAGERQADLLVREIVIYRKTIDNYKKNHEEDQRIISAMKGARKAFRVRFREMAEELQRYEENQMHSNLYDSERDERDMQIADELNSVYKYIFNSSNEGSMGRIVESIIKQLKGE